MLSLPKVRQILGPDYNLVPDDKIKEIRDSLYAIGEIVLEIYSDKTTTSKSIKPGRLPSQSSTKDLSFQDALETLSTTEKDSLIERVGIMEFDAGLDRNEAERKTLEQFFNAQTGTN